MALRALDGGYDSTIGAPPTDNEQITLRRSADFQQRNLIGNIGDFLCTRLDHVLMVLRIVADVSGNVFFLEPADAVFQAGRAGDGPLAYQAGIALVRQEFRFAVAVAVLFRGMPDDNLGQAVHIWNEPRLSP